MNVIFGSVNFLGRDFHDSLLRGTVIFQYKRFNFSYQLYIFKANSFGRSSKFSVVSRLPLKGFSYVRTLQTISINWVTLIDVSQLPQCGCLTCSGWMDEMYTDVPMCHMTQTLVYMAAVCSWWLCSILISVSYYSVAVWPALAGCTKCILMFLCVTWHRHW
jgi:hypothetical protein